MAPTVVVEFDYGMIDNTSLVLIPWARGIRAPDTEAILAFSCTIDFEATGT